MAKKPEIIPIDTSFNVVGTLNQNFQAVQEAFENTLSRDGSLPNFMEADLDMNSMDILNAGTIQSDKVFVGGQDFTGLIEEAKNQADRAEEEADKAVEAAQALKDATTVQHKAFLSVAGQRRYTLDASGRPLNVLRDAHTLSGAAPFGDLHYGADYTVSDGGIDFIEDVPAGHLFLVKTYPATTNTEALALKTEIMEAVDLISEAPQSWADFARFEGHSDGKIVWFNGVQFVRDRSASIAGLGAGAGWGVFGSVSPLHFSQTMNSAAIQLALDYSNTGTMVIPAGNYVLDTDIILRNKRIALSSGRGFCVEASGAEFTGAGRIVVDSCKRIQWNGGFAPSTDLVLNGCWFSPFSNLQFRDMILCESAGQVFTSNYWNSFNDCIWQSVVTSTGAAAGSNAFTLNNPVMKGNPGQGFTESRDYAFNFAGDHLAQGWVVNGGDVSYYNLGIYDVPASNPTREVSLHFNGTYFDSILPTLSLRPSVKVTTTNAVCALATGFSSPLDAATVSNTDMFVQSRAFKLSGTGGVNLIPNGDFRIRTQQYHQAGRPLVGLNGSTVTRQNGGLSGWHLNINQPLTAANTVAFRARATESGYYSALLAVKNADAGSKTIRLAFFGVYTTPVTISDSEYTLVPFQITNQKFGPDVNLDVGILTNDGTAFNVDVGYAGVFLGATGDYMSPPVSPLRQFHTFTYDAGSIAAGEGLTYAHTVTGAEPGDRVDVSASGSLQNISLTAYVASADTVALRFQNSTTGAVDLPSMTYRLWIEKPPF